jgi:hypothetical protein
MMDGILVFGKDSAERNSHLRDVLRHLEEANVTLNSSKCEFEKTMVKFLGHIIDSQGIRADPDKTEANRHSHFSH